MPVTSPLDDFRIREIVFKFIENDLKAVLDTQVICANQLAVRVDICAALAGMRSVTNNRN